LLDQHQKIRSIEVIIINKHPTKLSQLFIHKIN